MNIKEWHRLDKETVLEELGSSYLGLSEQEAKVRLVKFGFNQLGVKKTESLVTIFLRQFKSPLIYILLFAAIVSLFVGKMTNAAVIICVLITNAVMGFIQESRAKKTMESLRELSKPKTKVLRDGEIRDVPSQEIVPGDIILLESGDRISADARIIESVKLQVSEAALTGESHPVHKITHPVKAEMVVAERLNMVFAGTVIASGRGKAVIVETGMNTEIGKIAKMIEETPEPKTPFQLRMEGLGKIIIWIVIVQLSLALIIGRFVRGMPFYEIFMVALSQMVSSIPEGLPVAVIVALAIGMQRMAKRKAYVRKLAAVEGLGSATVICTDKTGTLTRNEMTAKRIVTMNEDIEISGVGYCSKGDFLSKGKKIDLKENKDIGLILRIACLCNNAKLSSKRVSSCENSQLPQDALFDVGGDPTEIAFLVAALKAGIELETLNNAFQRVDEIPFEPYLQMMATKHQAADSKLLTCVKGAPEKIVELCGYYLQDAELIPLNDALRKEILNKAEVLASGALRILALGFLEEDRGAGMGLDIDFIKGRLCFTGLIGNIDPPRPEVKMAIEECQKAGIRTIMVTGDHIATAKRIGIELNIMEEEGEAISGADLEWMTAEEVEGVVENFSVFARIEPKHKFQIVQALRKQGEVVAMTGDGVNDGPALAAADIGVSMGITGTDAAKEASSIVIADDNFATIVNAVEEGRAITTNMRKTLLYLLCSSNTEILVLLTALISGLPLPLLALQILWINLVTDGALTVNLIMEPKEAEMDRPPNKKDEPIVTKGLLKLLFFRAPIMAAGITGLFFYEISMGQPLIYARSVAFTVLAVTQWANGINCRSIEKSIFKMPFFGNKYLIAGLSIAVMLQIAIIYVPFLQNIFSTTALTLADWAKIILVGSSIIWAEELRKSIAKRI